MPNLTSRKGLELLGSLNQVIVLVMLLELSTAQNVHCKSTNKNRGSQETLKTSATSGQPHCTTAEIGCNILRIHEVKLFQNTSRTAQQFSYSADNTTIKNYNHQELKLENLL